MNSRMEIYSHFNFIWLLIPGPFQESWYKNLNNFLKKNILFLWDKKKRGAEGDPHFSRHLYICHFNYWYFFIDFSSNFFVYVVSFIDMKKLWEITPLLSLDRATQDTLTHVHVFVINSVSNECVQVAKLNQYITCNSRLPHFAKS